MELKKSKGKMLRTIFIRYILSLGVFIIFLIMINYLIFAVAEFGVYPANYSEKIIQKNFDEIKNSSEVTIDLLTPMCDFGVYAVNGEFLYGNFAVQDIDNIWDSYMKGKYSIGLTDYITSIEREEGVLIITYPLNMQFTSARLRRALPNAELIILVSFFLQLFLLIILWSNRFAKRINNELKTLLNAVKKIEEQNLDCDIGTSNIEDIDIVLQGMNKMKNSLKLSLEKQWLLERQKKEQISALAHDLRTPLTIVKGNVGLLQETDMTEEQIDYCDCIGESSIRIEIYLQNLQAITKEEVDNYKANGVVYIKSFITSLIKQGYALGQIKNIHIIDNIEIEDDLYIRGYKYELERAFMNIISNAVDFSPNNSTITIYSIIENSQLMIQIIDQGKGFSNKMLKYGKEQFYMDNESRSESGHHGLGLYISNNIITKYKGELILSNSKDGGGSVKVTIPLKTDKFDKEIH